MGILDTVGGMLGIGGTQGGTNVGNVFNGNGDHREENASHDAINNFLNYDPGSALNSNPAYASLFGNGGALSRALSQTQDLENNPGLTDQDRTAYGQASGDIARMFGQNEQSLSQALSDRGLSNSGVAGAAFSSSLGNKNEQLAHLQTQIAQNRENLNQQKLSNLRQFTTQLGAQAQGAVGQGADIAANKSTTGSGYLNDLQNQWNEQLSQQQQTKTPSAGMQLLSAGTNLIGAMSGGGGGGGGGPAKAATMAGA